MKRIITFYLRPFYARMFVGFAVKFVGSVMELIIPYLLAHIIDIVIPMKEKNLIYTWGLIMIICSIIGATLNIISNRIASKVASGAIEMLRNDLFKKVMSLTSMQCDRYTKPSIISRLTSDTYNVHQMIVRVQRLGVRAPILLIGGIIITLTMEPILTLVLLCTTPFLAMVIFFVSKKSFLMYASLQESIDRFVRLIREDISGIRVIKALSKENIEKDRFASINNEIAQREKKVKITMASIDPSMQLILNIGLIAIIIVGAILVNSGITEVGKILAFMTYFTIILHAVISMSKIFDMFSKSSASAMRIIDLLDAKEELKIEEFAKHSEDALITFEHVSFSYDKRKDNLTDISFQIKKGETLGIIGETGAGKSTIASLMMRLFDVDKGAVYIEGKNVKSIEYEELHKRFGVIFQNDTIFEDTIKQNISLDRSFSEEEIKNAIYFAGANEFIESNENKMDANLYIKGANLSGGQKQRILIARALVSHPDILILDDSSSALDYKTDAKFRNILKKYFADIAVVTIAQRISSIKKADHILVLENGKMIGYGNHDELIESCDVYKEIYLSQMGAKL